MAAVVVAAGPGTAVGGWLGWDVLSADVCLPCHPTHPYTRGTNPLKARCPLGTGRKVIVHLLLAGLLVPVTGFQKLAITRSHLQSAAADGSMVFGQ